MQMETRFDSNYGTVSLCMFYYVQLKYIEIGRKPTEDEVNKDIEYLMGQLDIFEKALERSTKDRDFASKLHDAANKTILARERQDFTSLVVSFRQLQELCGMDKLL